MPGTKMALLDTAMWHEDVPHIMPVRYLNRLSTATFSHVFQTEELMIENDNWSPNSEGEYLSRLLKVVQVLQDRI